jgi:hypothetical protein
MRNFDAEVEVVWERKHTLYVRGETEEGRPAYRKGHPDDWHPSEGREVYISQIRLLRICNDGSNTRRLPRKTEVMLINNDAFVELVADRLEREG